MSHDSTKDRGKLPIVGRLSRTFNASNGKLVFDPSNNGSAKISPQTHTSQVMPFIPDPHGGVVSGRHSIGYEPIRRISAQAAPTNDSTVMAFRAVAKLNRNLKSAHHSKKSMQKLDVDRHSKVLEQYIIRLHDKKAGEYSNPVSQSFPLLIVSPAARWYKMWQLFTLCLIVYQSFQIPYVLGFGTSNSSPLRDYESIIVNFIFGIDFLLNCTTAIPDPNHPNLFITSRSKIFLAYLRGWLFLDLVACFPIDVVMFLFVDNSGSSSSGTFNFLNLLKAVRLPRLLRLARLVRILKILQIPPEWKRWLLYSRYSHLIRLITTIVLFFFTIHICACVWNGSIASAEWRDMYPSVQPGEVNDYILSFFFCLETFLGQTLNLHNQSEFVFSIILIFSGALLMAAVFGDVAVLLANFHEKQNNYKKKMESLFSCMGTMRLPLDLQNRINEFYQTMWETHETLNGQPATLTSELSRNLAVEVELFLRMDMINRVPIFHSCSKRVVQEIVMKLSMEVFLPGDYIVVRGEVAFEMYFVQAGICEVTKGGRDSSEVNFTLQVEEESVIRLLRQGDFFGEIALLMQCKRTANVRAKTFAELCVLTRDVFEAITERYVEDRERMEKLITEKYDPAVLHQIAEQRKAADPNAASAQINSTSNLNNNAFQAAERKFIMDNLSKLNDRVGGLERKLEAMESRQERFFDELKGLLLSSSAIDSPMHAMVLRANCSSSEIAEGSSSDEDEGSPSIHPSDL